MISNLHKRIYATAAGFLITAAAFALTLDEAKEAYGLGDFEEALPTLMQAADADPKNAAVNQMAGIALFHLGREAEATGYLKRGQNESNLYLARIAMHDYRFDDADEILDRYEAGFKKGRRGAVPERPEATAVREEIEKGRVMLDRVEKIVIIDSLDVDRESFFKSYRLSPTAGSLFSPDLLPRGFEAGQPTVVYASENSDNIYWAAPDSMENFRIVTSSLLADKSWERPTMFTDALNEGGDANYPFLMSDGVTLYFANTGENSLGGYDIFISRRDGDDFLQPQNIGMPYNSYANDYMMAIDEESGIGWWATDRNAAPDRLTIYVFVPSDLRVNYPSDFPGLTSRARIDTFRDTWEPGSDYSNLIRTAREGSSTANARKAEFRFAIPGRGVYTSLDDFRSSAARDAMSRYLKAKNAFETDCRRLEALRKSYGRGQTSVGDDILELERQVEQARTELRTLSNGVVNAEK